ncbi:MAG: VOC family protein [Alphaproteobacteria bacterium]
MATDRLLVNIATADIGKSKDFYVQLLGLHLHYDSDWFVNLKPAEASPIELGQIDLTHEVVPDQVLGPAAGIYLTFVVDDVLATLKTAGEMGVEIIEGPTDLFYGQRRILLRDPDGIILDISSPTPG